MIYWFIKWFVRLFAKTAVKGTADAASSHVFFDVAKVLKS